MSQTCRLSAIFVVAIGAIDLVQAADAPPKKTSFVVLLCDDLGYNELGCFGHPEVRTPNIDRLAAEGMRLTDYYTAAPVCSPARAGLMTGRVSYRYGIDSHLGEGSATFLSTQEITIATLLKGAGYATCHVGKWHLNGKFNVPEHAQPNDHGFDHWFSTQSNTQPHDSRENRRLNPTTFVRNGTSVGPLEGCSSALMVDEAVRWLEGLPAERPFFLYVCFHSAHIPLAASEEFLSLYPKRNVKFADISEMDAAVGRLMAGLDRLKRRDDALVLFTSDNGPLNKPADDFRPREGAVGPLHGAKFQLYEGGIRVPGIVRWPTRIKPGEVCAEPIGSIDFLPTACAIAGIKPPDDRPIDGSSFLPIIDHRPIVRKTPLYWIGGGSALRDGDWKLIRFQKRTELYDLKHDPCETRDLVEQEPSRLKQLSATLDRLVDEARKTRYVTRK